MYDYRDTEQRRKQIKQRYNRRFFIGTHIVALVLVAVLQFFGLPLGAISALLAIALVPHLVYVAYLEYRDWLEVKVDRVLHGTDDHYPGSEKRKRYPSESTGEPTFRLLDDGEIEQVYPQKQPHYEEERSKPYKKQDKKDRKRRKPSKKRRKFDTDEFDVKKILKKLKDIVD
jgi:hypothetical protein